MNKKIILCLAFLIFEIKNSFGAGKAFMTAAEKALAVLHFEIEPIIGKFKTSKTELGFDSYYEKIADAISKKLDFYYKNPSLMVREFENKTKLEEAQIKLKEIKVSDKTERLKKEQEDEDFKTAIVQKRKSYNEGRDEKTKNFIKLQKEKQELQQEFQNGINKTREQPQYKYAELEYQKNKPIKDAFNNAQETGVKNKEFSDEIERLKNEQEDEDSKKKFFIKHSHLNKIGIGFSTIAIIGGIVYYSDTLFPEQKNEIKKAANSSNLEAIETKQENLEKIQNNKNIKNNNSFNQEGIERTVISKAILGGAKLIDNTLYIQYNSFDANTIKNIEESAKKLKLTIVPLFPEKKILLKNQNTEKEENITNENETLNDIASQYVNRFKNWITPSIDQFNNFYNNLKENNDISPKTNGILQEKNTTNKFSENPTSQNHKNISQNNFDKNIQDAIKTPTEKNIISDNYKENISVKSWVAPTAIGLATVLGITAYLTNNYYKKRKLKNNKEKSSKNPKTKQNNFIKK